MPPPLYTQTVVAFIWDYDRTLIPGNQQDPIFDEYGVDPDEFWGEVDGLVDHYASLGLRVAKDTAYLTHMLTYVEQRIFAGLNRSKLRELGGRVPLNPGVIDLIDATKQRVAATHDYERHGITVEHYVVSTGIIPMIEGSPLYPHLNGVWANDFIENPAPPGYRSKLAVPTDDAVIRRLGYTVDNTTKTRAIFEINKGANRNKAIDVNARMSEEQRRVPIRNMIYVADGPSDVPCFSIVNAHGGKTFGVYLTEPKNNFSRVKALQEQGRVQGMAKADFRAGEAAYLWLMDSLEQICDEIVSNREQAFSEIRPAPGHV